VDRAESDASARRASHSDGWASDRAYLGIAHTKKGRGARRDATRAHVMAMSALPPKADIGTRSRDVRFVPIADIVGCLLHLAPLSVISSDECLREYHVEVPAH